MFRSVAKKLVGYICAMTQMSADRPLLFIILSQLIFVGTGFLFFGLAFVSPSWFKGIIIPWIIMPVMGIQSFYFWPLLMRALTCAAPKYRPSILEDIFKLYGGEIRENDQ